MVQARKKHVNVNNFEETCRVATCNIECVFFVWVGHAVWNSRPDMKRKPPLPP